MKTISAEQAENEAARNWCAGILAGAGSQMAGDVAKRWVEIGAEALLNTDEGEDRDVDETKRLCDEAYNKSVAHPHHPNPSICVVNGRGYRVCRTCPLYMG